MGNTRTLIAWLGVLSCLQLVPHVTYAEDAGPGREVRAIRHALPIIMARRLRGSGLDPKALITDSVSVNGNNAIAIWHDASFSETSSLHYKLGTWWYDSAPEPQLATISTPLLGITLKDSYGITLWLEKNDAQKPVWPQLHVRAPTEGESWITPYSNGYCFFSMTFQSAATVHVDAGTKLDVWFPFVLNPKKTYSLSVAHADPIIAVNGALEDNTLHFVLPAFAVAPGVELMGEIDGDPFDR